MTDTASTGRRRDPLYTWAVLLSSLVIPVPLLVGAVVEALLDATNPARVDVTQDLAYLRELLGLGFGSLGLLLVAIVALYVTIYRRDRTLDALALPLLVLAAQVVVGVAILLANGAVDSVEDSYVAAVVLLR